MRRATICSCNRRIRQSPRPEHRPRPASAASCRVSSRSSNVNVVTEITNLITAQRAYEMNSKVITVLERHAPDTHEPEVDPMNRHARNLAALAVSVAGIVALPVASNAATLRSFIEISGSSVRLSDLFDELGPVPDRVLGAAPAPGDRITVNSPQLAAIAQDFDVAWRPSTGAENVVVQRAGLVLSPGAGERAHQESSGRRRRAAICRHLDARVRTRAASGGCRGAAGNFAGELRSCRRPFHRAAVCRTCRNGARAAPSVGSGDPDDRDHRSGSRARLGQHRGRGRRAVDARACRIAARSVRPFRRTVLSAWSCVTRSHKGSR